MMIELARVLLLALAASESWTGLAETDPPTLSPQEGDQVKSAKKALQFASWPGKHGPLKPGVKFVPANVPSLTGFAVSRDTLEVLKVADEPILMRAVTLTQGSTTVRIELRVSQKSTDAAQEALLGSVRRIQAELDSWIRGDQNGIALGDLNFVDSLDLTHLGSVNFVRNNICVVLQGMNGPTAHLVEMATAIDALMVQEPDFTAATLASQIPVISQFSPQANPIGLLSSTPIKLEASDPQQRTLQYIFNGNFGQIRVDRTLSPPGVTFVTTTQAGTAQIDLLVVNENLLYATARAEVTVTK